MQVIYGGRDYRDARRPPLVEGDAIELFADGWDDAGYKTTFRVSCRIDGKPLELGMIRLLVDGAKTTRDALNPLLSR